MRDLVFKNLTSQDKKRKVLSSREVFDKKGVHNIIRRNFVCVLKEIEYNQALPKPLPSLYVFKEHNTKEEREKFFCRIKGSIYTTINGKLFLLFYVHSLKIDLTNTPLAIHF